MRIIKYRTLLNDNLPSLVKERAVNYEGTKLDSPEVVADMLNTTFQHGYETEEVVYLICFNVKMMLIGVFELSRGAVSTTVMNPREALVKALLCNAVSIIVAHNHPSGDTTPSQQDIACTEQLKQACKITGLVLRDSLIVTNEKCYSILKEEK